MRPTRPESCLRYTIINDIAARDIQYADGRWDLSKSLDSFCPMGPVIVDRNR